MKKISLKDIAESLGVSKALVSLVLNDKGDERGINKQTQQKVRDKAKELNYVPNQYARGLRVGKTDTLGVIVPDISNVQVQINSEARGYSPLEVEQRVTYPIETIMSGLPSLDYTRSISRFGLSQVTVVFKDGTDIYFARFMERQTGQEFFADFVPFAENPEYLADSAISSKDDVLSKDTKAVNAESIVSKNITELSIPPIFIEGQKELLTEKNITKLKKIIDFMNAHRAVSIELFAHSNFGDIIEYNLYSSLKLAEKITEFLAKYGVQKDKILIKGLGDNYPIVKTVRDGGDPVLSSSYNARIDFKFHDAPDQLSVNYDDGIDVPLLMRDVKYDLFRAISDASLTYKIQIATVNQMYRGMALSLFNDSCIEPDTKTGLYAYTIGLYDTYAKALQTKRELERDGLVNTQVVPYIDGIRLHKDDIVYYVNKYPDLKNYMNYVNVIGSN